ncbi:uncharacterized protein LOC131013449 [Salvia miltiorrhiza]|uniref:uncharacterized protein LOC131013449 n=1 Tax=Salvia miltiorrhiza TaxID=226208 RepID=UPI0025AC23F8|nr:uncharacterized protein LOC131013449 [Salvia miltiorrhiza]
MRMLRNNTRGTIQMEKRIESLEAQLGQLKQHQVEMNQSMMVVFRKQFEELRKELRVEGKRVQAEGREERGSASTNSRAEQMQANTIGFIYIHSAECDWCRSISTGKKRHLDATTEVVTTGARKNEDLRRSPAK